MSTLRSRFIHFILTAALLAGITLAGYTPAASQGIYNEAPMLAELVRAGKLPPVDERMPANPVLIKPVEEVGQYGGTWRLAKVKGDTGIIWRNTTYEGLVRWNPQWTAVIPNMAQTFEASPDATTYTFKLRKGVRWSDGAPFTADDLLFWYKDVYLNAELKPTHFIFLNGMEEKFTFEKVDDYTVKFAFKTPYGLFMQQMATLSGSAMLWYPKHFLQKYHPTYNPNIDDLIKTEGVANWVELFNKHRDGSVTSVHPGTPALFAWIFEEDTVISATPGDVFSAVRNPYYWKIDTEFNQLPYIDRVEFTVVGSNQEATDLAIAGKIDMQDRSIISAEIAKPENQAKGDYKTYTTIVSASNDFTVFFNYTSDDPVKREIFQNRNFRIGLSHGINREAILGKLGLKVAPAQAAPLPGSPYYDEEMTKQFLAYNVELANEYLDKAGYKRNTEGKRLGPDGNPIRFTVTVPDPYLANAAQVYEEQIQADWLALGIDVQMQHLPRLEADALISPEKETFNKFDVLVWSAEGGFDVIQGIGQYIPLGFTRTAPRWAVWYRDPNSPLAQVPPDYIQAQYDLYRQLLVSADAEQQAELVKQIVGIAKEQFYVIGINQPNVIYGVVSNRFYNVPAVMPNSYSYPNPAPTNPCQYFIK